MGGRIQPGADVDIVVFDLSTISDRATFDNPAQTSVGFEQVLVAGEQLVRNGIFDESILPGQPIRRNVIDRGTNNPYSGLKHNE